jgi:tRNA threonylcarbamoyladenosine biosynthesis protein TsaB
MKNNSETPLILAIETATEACSAALAIGDDITVRFEIAPRQHTQLILTMMDEVLTEAGVTLKQVDAIAFSRGPGAFTGVRIATGVAHGVALSIDKQLLPISTLAAIAQQLHENEGIEQCVVAIDARMGEIYWGRYVAQQGFMLLQDDEAVSKPEVLQAVVANFPDCILAGKGWDAYGEHFDVSTMSKLNKAHNILPSAHSIARLAVTDYKQGKAVDIEQAQPIYLRDKVAQTIAERRAIK